MWRRAGSVSRAAALCGLPPADRRCCPAAAADAPKGLGGTKLPDKKERKQKGGEGGGKDGAAPKPPGSAKKGGGEGGSEGSGSKEEKPPVPMVEVKAKTLEARGGCGGAPAMQG